MMCPGCLETRIYSRIGIPTVAYGPGPATEMHEPSEHVLIANVVEATNVIAQLLGYTETIRCGFLVARRETVLEASGEGRG